MSKEFEPSEAFAQSFDQLLRWRRDVRHFKTDPVDDGVLKGLIEQACLAPSVGNSQPWRFLSIEKPETRAAVRENFIVTNAQAANLYTGERRETYDKLKLAGLVEAPIHLAVCADMETETGKGLGRQTMPETLLYSTVCAIHTLWLGARARGLGLGWVSILDVATLVKTLDVPESWQFVAYLCLGFPAETHEEPELERRGWEARSAAHAHLLRR
ncbi:MAG: 5,6-dimethylbenzimidazole synthase [Parvibaculum sp.]